MFLVSGCGNEQITDHASGRGNLSQANTDNFLPDLGMSE